jgi:hypothetical protein
MIWSSHRLSQINARRKMTMGGEHLKLSAYEHIEEKGGVDAQSLCQNESVLLQSADQVQAVRADLHRDADHVPVLPVRSAVCV